MTSFDPQLFSQALKCLNPTQRALLADINTINSSLEQDSISDYSFLVAPAAKAYEGFLKEFLLKIGLIDKHQYQSDRFRVGKALNPSLRFKRFSVFQKLTDLDASGQNLAQTLWQAWKRGRNLVFHYFPNNIQKLSLAQARQRILTILRAIIQANRFLTQNFRRRQQNLL